MKKKSVLSKLIVLLVVTNFIVAYGTTVVVSSRINKVLDDELHEEMYIILQTLDWAIQPLLNGENHDEIQVLIDKIAEYPIVERIRVYDSNQEIKFSNYINEKNEIIENVCVNAVFMEGASIKSREDLDNNIYEAAIPVVGSGIGNEKSVQAVIFISADMDYITAQWKDIIAEFQTVFIVSSIVLIVISSLYVYFVIGTQLKQFKIAADAITNKNYDYKIKDNVKGEFLELKSAYDEMRFSIKDYTKELENAQREIEEASDAKMLFLTNMSHEIRTPLNSILGFAELLEEEESDNDKKSQLKIIHKSGTHLLSVINDLLDFSKLENEQMEIEIITFNMRELVRGTSDFFYIELKKKNIQYSYDISNTVPMYCRSDENKIRQILINLLSNAIKFTMNGDIHVAIDYIEPQLIIKVSDSGIGIAEENLETIFETFTQSDNSIARKYGGTGLGLSICKSFAHMLNGQISVESEINKGTTFTCSFEVVVLESDKLVGRSILCTWLNADSDLADLVYDAILSLPERIQLVKKDLVDKNMAEFAESIHALKGLCGNFQMHQLYTLFVSIDKELKNEVQDFDVIEDVFGEIEAMVSLVAKAAENHCSLNELPTSSNHIERPKSNQEKSFRKLKILVAEDIIENQILVERILKPLDHYLVFANNGLEAMNLLKESTYDCMLLDIQMPELSGDGVLEAIHDIEEKGLSFNKPYIIVISAHATVTEKEKYIKLGADDYLSKPINKKVLRTKISKLSDEH